MGTADGHQQMSLNVICSPRLSLLHACVTPNVKDYGDYNINAQESFRNSHEEYLCGCKTQSGWSNRLCLTETTIPWLRQRRFKQVSNKPHWQIIQSRLLLTMISEAICKLQSWRWKRSSHTCMRTGKSLAFIKENQRKKLPPAEVGSSPSAAVNERK